jgi:hypothetical protein
MEEDIVEGGGGELGLGITASSTSRAVINA